VTSTVWRTDSARGRRGDRCPRHRRPDQHAASRRTHTPLAKVG